MIFDFCLLIFSEVYGHSQQALDSLRQHTFRSVLTLLGIVWGIVAVTVLIAYGDGQKAKVKSRRKGYPELIPDLRFLLLLIFDF